MTRPFKRLLLRAITLQGRAAGFLDKLYIAKDVPSPSYIRHENWQAFVTGLAVEQNLSVLEVGSREVTGKSYFRGQIKKYVGFDIYPGRNVDVVGDAHHLSRYFPNQQFDLVISSSCFEHFVAPWVVALEISKVLQLGGSVFVETHFSFSSHERPWHFYHFTDLGLRALFSDALGFECIDAGMSSPIVGRFSRLAAKPLRGRPVIGLYGHSEFYGRKVKNVAQNVLDERDIASRTDGTSYPLPHGSQLFGQPDAHPLRG